MATLSTYWHTLRYLKLSQLYGRLWFKFYRPRVDLAPPPPLRKISDTWVKPVQKTNSMLAPYRFCFLNETHDLEPQEWDNSELEKLWRYNLHYFDDLNGVDAVERLDWHHDLLLRWVRENPPGSGTAWEPYPTSLRIVNWIKWTLAGNTLPAECLHSLAVQIRWLARRLEYHVLGNHLFSNAKAMVFAGVFFSGAEAAQWLNRGLAILAREIPEQILPDGGHFERSTMYHALALEDMLDLINLVKALPAEFFSGEDYSVTWSAIAVQMARWLKIMTLPDGEISFFNDATMGIAPSLLELTAYGHRLGVTFPDSTKDSLVRLPESGYQRLELFDAVLLLDVAPIGADYLPGHAHADSLCFELAIDNQRVFVNSGISCYGTSPERLRQRSTDAHNTVTIDGQNSSEVWGGFRVARRAQTQVERTHKDEDNIVVEASHDGYRRLAGKNLHCRKWSISANKVIVQDKVIGRFKNAEARFHLHPEVEIDTRLIIDMQVKLLLPHGRKVEFSVEGGDIRVESTSWHPGFGISVPNKCIVVTFRESKITTLIAWHKAV